MYREYYGYDVDYTLRNTNHHSLAVGELVCGRNSVGIVAELLPGWEYYNVRTPIMRGHKVIGTRLRSMQLPQRLDMLISRLDRTIARYANQRTKVLLRRAAVIEQEYIAGDPDRKLAAETARLKAAAERATRTAHKKKGTA